MYEMLFLIIYYIFPKQSLTVGVLAVTLGGQSGRLRRSTFMRRRGTWCMLPRSRAGEKVARVTFREKTQWFQHAFPLSPENGPGGSRGIPDASRGLLGALPGLSGGVPEGLFGILLPEFFLQICSSEIPPPGILLGDSSSRIPP